MTEDATQERFYGVYPGEVTETVDPADEGRVRVNVPSALGDQGTWAEILRPMAGDDYGAYFPLEVGEIVLVAFEAGNPKHPFVLGPFWDAAPPMEEADDGTDYRMIESRSGHKIVFDDTEAGGVTIETDAGHEISLDDGAESESIRIEDKSGNNSIEMDAATGEVSIEAGSKLSLSAPTVEISGRSQLSVATEGVLTLEGGLIKLN